jgi:hypothetical protein
MASLWHGPLLIFLDHLFCLSQWETRWTMAVIRVGLKKIKDLNLRGHYAIFSLV